MSAHREQEAPALSNEVWRGKNMRGVTVAVTLDEGRPVAWFHDFVWQTNDSPLTFRTWALHERERAERARGLARAALRADIDETQAMINALREIAGGEAS